MHALPPIRSRVSSDLLPRLRAFCPDLLFISAGFDAHYDDMYHYLSEVRNITF
jgi:acetoin utilization deacetylase AcuC-like enzyme